VPCCRSDDCVHLKFCSCVNVAGRRYQHIRAPPCAVRRSRGPSRPSRRSVQDAWRSYGYGQCGWCCGHIAALWSRRRTNVSAPRRYAASSSAFFFSHSSIHSLQPHKRVLQAYVRSDSVVRSPAAPPLTCRCLSARTGR
jgi:hypothetical protein